MNRDTLEKHEVIEISIAVLITKDQPMDRAMALASTAIHAAEEWMAKLNGKRFTSGISVRRGTKSKYRRSRSTRRSEPVIDSGRPQ